MWNEVRKMKKVTGFYIYKNLKKYKSICEKVGIEVTKEGYFEYERKSREKR